MKLYYMKGACSLASYISLTEAGIKFEAAEVEHGTHKTRDGEDLNAINTKGYVPVLRLDTVKSSLKTWPCSTISGT